MSCDIAFDTLPFALLLKDYRLDEPQIEPEFDQPIALQQVPSLLQVSN